MSGWEGLLKFLEKPETMALAAGLLTSPNNTFSGSFGHGLQAMQGRSDKEREHLREQGKLKVLEGGLDVDRSKVGLLQRGQELEEKKFGLNAQEFNQKAQNFRDLMNSFMPANNQSQPQIPFVQTQQATPPAAPQIPAQQFSPMGGAAMSSPSLLDPNSLSAPPAPTFAGLLNANDGQQQGPASPYMPPPVGLLPPNMQQDAPAPQVPPVSNAPIPEGAGIQGALERREPQNEGLIRLNNGMEVTPAQAKAAQMYMLAGKPEKAIEALSGDLTEPEIVKVARAIYGDITSAEARRFMHDAKLKPSTQVNIGDNTEKVKQQKIAELDVKTLGDAQEREKPSRELVRRAKETKSIAQEMRKRNLDPSRYWLTSQLDRNKIASALGSKASQENVALVERLNKNAVYLMSEQVKSLGGRPNQFIEQQFAKAVPGQNVSLDTIETLSDALIPFGAEGQYEARFLRAYDQANGSLDGATETYEKWLDTKPFAKPGKDGLLVPATDREIAESWKLWVDPELTYARLSQKPIEKATRAEIEFMARYNQ